MSDLVDGPWSIGEFSSDVTDFFVHESGEPARIKRLDATTTTPARTASTQARCGAQQTSPSSGHRVVNPSKESSTMHLIRKLRESGHATAADYETILAANVVFHSPVLIRTIEGRAVVAKIFAASTTLREGAYTGEWKLDERRTLLRWKGKIEGHELESFDIIEENDEGLIVDRTVAFRPMPAAKLFRDAMRSAIGSSVPDDFWEYSN